MPRHLLFLMLPVLGILFAYGPDPTVAQPGTPPSDPEVNLAGIKALPLTGARRAEFDAYVAAAMRRFGMVGASVAVVQGDQVSYLQGFGTTEMGGAAPVTGDTVMAIGSTTKAVTSLMAATVVDEGRLAWETPIVDLVPDFATADPALTPRLTLEDAFCACSGLPTRTWQLFFTFDGLTPERMIASVADIPVTAGYHEKFQYSNQMVAVGGWGAGVAAGGNPVDLAGGYRQAMADRVLGPIGMTRSTFDIDQVIANGDYAQPNAADLVGETRPLPLRLDARFIGNAAGPAGGMWSSAADMARYVQTLLAGGVAPDGTRVVSAANLQRVVAPGVALASGAGGPSVLTNASQHYALGWEVGNYKGQPLISHGGETWGFVSQVAFLPEADLGLVILTNGGPGAIPFTYAVQYRLFELLFEQPEEFGPVSEQQLAARLDAFRALRAQVGPVDTAEVAAYEGRYTNPVLGEIGVAMRDGRLFIEAGGMESELVARLDGEGQTTAYLFADLPLARFVFPVTLRRDAAGRPEVVITTHSEVPDAAYTGDVPEIPYVFTLVE